MKYLFVILLLFVTLSTVTSSFAQTGEQNTIIKIGDPLELFVTAGENIDSNDISVSGMVGFSLHPASEEFEIPHPPQDGDETLIFEFMEQMKAFMINFHTKAPFKDSILYDLKIDELPKTFNFTVVPPAKGMYYLSLYDEDELLEHPFPNVSGSWKRIFVIEKFAKAYEQNQGCRENFQMLIKSDYSTLVCVTSSTYAILQERDGWGLTPIV
ncbi:MAG: hypothetical protein ACR2LL_12490 [Nitrosopumilus sp.]